MEEKKNSYLARLAAAFALIAAAVVIFLVIGGAISGNDDSGSDTRKQAREAPVKPKTKKKVYKVEEGDNLTTIANKTGIPVDQLEKLNPDLDPQALQPGQKLKLR